MKYKTDKLGNQINKRLSNGKIAGLIDELEAFGFKVGFRRENIP